ncbi:hypothetical protein PTTG_03381 [Puccinia triticina 1-1 BBBD Race 1]|uniref:Reelin domain-containing protein n=2 Tax=Puccinia triticina TaxID=208348 RepID=A0A180GNH2_PUCT1|nr:uncharacterized protein PtA15_13A176 [Puccinia triticina]OAV94357.1 hypothetical protein PTTG_03381 [Puccinia triticina 1-1 BBBD Race 1]WAQ90777.1 hypothetical protein PtA15_13A176 [Puccinia triticina]WAR60963.1 hypothetical protein PtB15_13B214 [Puccinia triticina]
MISLITTCLLLANAATSLAVSADNTVKILSPAPGANFHAGASLNVTLQIEKDSMKGSQQVLLGFGLNSGEAQHPTSLGEVFLGLLNTTQTPFDAEGKLTWSMSIPAREQMNSAATSFSLVVSQYMFSGPSHTPHCGLVSVPVQVSADPNGSGAGNGNSASCPAGSNCPTSNDPSAKSGPSSPSAMNTTSTPKSVPDAKANMTSTEISAKGHNTGSTIPGTVVKGSVPDQATTPTKTNGTSSPTNPAPKTENTTPSSKANGTNSPPPTDSGAAPLAISTSHVIAAVAVIAGIFATA